MRGFFGLFGAYHSRIRWCCGELVSDAGGDDVITRGYGSDQTAVL